MAEYCKNCKNMADQITKLHKQGNALLLEAAKDRQEIERLKEILTKDIVTIESVIQEITTNRNIHDTLWFDDYNTMVDVLNAMLEEKKTIKNGKAKDGE